VIPVPAKDRVRADQYTTNAGFRDNLTGVPMLTTPLRAVPGGIPALLRG